MSPSFTPSAPSHRKSVRITCPVCKAPLFTPLPLPAAPLHTHGHSLSQGGFQAEMTRREAALILGLRESAAEERIKEAHRRIMIANHPDSGNQHSAEAGCDHSICHADHHIMPAAGPFSAARACRLGLQATCILAWLLKGCLAVHVHQPAVAMDE
jgi:hypothetical protein